jgi:hypothetical protein
MCNYQGYEFGANYPDSICIRGKLYDADYCDGQGRLYKTDEDVPCPMCRQGDAVKWWAIRFEGEYKRRLKSARTLVRDIRKNRKNGTEPWKSGYPSYVKDSSKERQSS